MLTVNSQRQITLPLELCEQADIEAGDEVEIFVYQNQITLVKKVMGAAKGILQHLEIDENLTDEQSLESGLNTGL